MTQMKLAGIEVQSRIQNCFCRIERCGLRVCEPVAVHTPRRMLRGLHV